MEIVRKLLATVDAVTENFRPGTMDKLGLGYEDVKKLGPQIICCSLKGFLPGPYEHRAALDGVRSRSRRAAGWSSLRAAPTGPSNFAAGLIYLSLYKSNPCD